MGTAVKPPPFVCFKWPWNPDPETKTSPSPCGDLELPWLFKSIHTVAQGLLIAGDLPSPASSEGGGAGRRRQRYSGAVAVEADRGDAEQRALAAALSNRRAATVLEFYSPRCGLCSSLQGIVREIEDGADGWASFVLADAEDDRWLPEPTSQYEHLSIPATVKKIFNLKEFVTKRDAWAGTFESVLTRATPRTDCPASLPEPVRLRSAEAEAEEHREISEFQAELVQLGAALNGDHAKDGYDPDRHVEGMTVAATAEYCRDAFGLFREECERCRECSMDGSHVPTVQPAEPALAINPVPAAAPPAFASKLCCCFPCFNA